MPGTLQPRFPGVCSSHHGVDLQERHGLLNRCWGSWRGSEAQQATGPNPRPSVARKRPSKAKKAARVGGHQMLVPHKPEAAEELAPAAPGHQPPSSVNLAVEVRATPLKILRCPFWRDTFAARFPPHISYPRPGFVSMASAGPPWRAALHPRSCNFAEKAPARSSRNRLTIRARCAAPSHPARSAPRRAVAAAGMALSPHPPWQQPPAQRESCTRHTPAFWQRKCKIPPSNSPKTQLSTFVLGYSPPPPAQRWIERSILLESTREIARARCGTGRRGGRYKM